MLAFAFVAFAGCGAGITDALSGTAGMYVQTEDELASSGLAGGPFLPASIDYDISNVGTIPMTWSVSSDQPWVDVTPANGALDPLQSESIAVTFAPSAAQLLPGAYMANVTFVNQTDGIGNTTRHVQLTVEDDGWTVFTASPDTRKVYVSSSSGSDSNDGLSPATAKQTIAAGRNLIRDGYPDWLLLKCGDTWNTGIGNWQTRGRSPTEPQLISSYGTGARPLVSSGSGNGLDLAGQIPCANLSIFNIHFRGREGAETSSPHGLRILTAGPNLLVEGCYFEHFFNGITIQSYGTPNRFTNVRLRRNVVTENYAVDAGHTQGAFLSGIDDLLIEENIFHHNGWSETRPHATGRTIYRHCIYIQSDCSGIENLNNFYLEGSATGISQRSGGLIEGNIVARNPVGIGVSNGPSITCRNNLIMEGANIDTSNPRGWAIHSHSSPSITLQSNIAAHNLGDQPAGFDLANSGGYTGMTDFQATDNITYNWKAGIGVGGPLTTISTIQVVGNILQESTANARLISHSEMAQLPRVSAAGNNRLFNTTSNASHTWVAGTPYSLAYWMSQVGDSTSAVAQTSLRDPSRTIATYHAHIGRTGTYQAFVQELLRQAPANWRSLYTTQTVREWIAAGYQPL